MSIGVCSKFFRDPVLRDWDSEGEKRGPNTVIFLSTLRMTYGLLDFRTTGGDSFLIEGTYILLEYLCVCVNFRVK